MRSLALVIFLIGLCGCSTGPVPVARPHQNPPLGRLTPERGVVLEGPAAKQIFSQCSRLAPSCAEGLWIPDSSTIERLEDAFPAFYDQIRPIRFRSLDGYYRQYAGFIAGERKFVYVSFFTWAIPSKELQRQDPVRWDPDLWRKVPIVICDGGSKYFGAVYDPESDTFIDLQENGF